MQDVKTELPHLINALLQSPPHHQRRLIQSHYTPSCRLTHALLVAPDREQIIAVFQYWRFITCHLSAQIQDIILDTETNSKVVVVLNQRVKGMFKVPFLNFDLSMTVLMYLREEQRVLGKKYYIISKQVDYHNFESILYSLPVVGTVFDRGVRAVLSWCIINPTLFVGRIWPEIERRVSRMVPDVLKKRGRMPVWERMSMFARNVWWWRWRRSLSDYSENQRTITTRHHHRHHGLQALPPYNPSL